MKIKVHEDSECPTYLWDKGEQVVIDCPIAAEISPIEIHVKPDGTNLEQPSLVFIMGSPCSPVTFVAQISLSKIWPAIETAIKANGPLS